MHTIDAESFGYLWNVLKTYTFKCESHPSVVLRGFVIVRPKMLVVVGVAFYVFDEKQGIIVYQTVFCSVFEIVRRRFAYKTAVLEVVEGGAYRAAAWQLAGFYEFVACQARF